VVIESNNKSNVQPIYNPLEILKKEGNYNELHYDTDIVMYPIANFYRLNIDDESENEYTINNNSSSSIINSNFPSSNTSIDIENGDGKYTLFFLIIIYILMHIKYINV